MKLERLISIIYKLLNHDVISAAALADEFGVSQRTIYRDIDAICAAGFPVVSYQGQNGGYGIMDGYKMDRSLLGSYDVSSLITVLASLSSVFEDERAQGTIERLKTIDRGRETVSLEVDLETNRTEPELLPLLRKAISERKVVAFDYINWNNERTNRELEPLSLHFKYGNWYIQGYCRSRQGEREFRLSRMLNPVVTETVYTLRDALRKEESATQRPLKDGVADVVLKVGPETLAEAMDHFNFADREFLDDGSMMLRIPVYRPLEARWLWSILLGFGGGAEVLEPRELRAILKDQLRKAIKLYEEV
ncbi:helix-turn-helix transcriptional regulator [Paenibacillus agaridevorans]|uniref:helix-turn-helix transcriptional regulator n=1 Tax=Paenibacillus agaridevorans TaxID=171404 RepID=UPI001BE4D3B4|nr:YafY family protein [Paenibacillus agaridevorans]